MALMIYDKVSDFIFSNNEKVTEVFAPGGFIKLSTDGFIFIYEIYDEEFTLKGEIVKQYKFGTEKSIEISDSKIEAPLTYFYLRGAFAQANF